MRRRVLFVCMGNTDRMRLYSLSGQPRGCIMSRTDILLDTHAECSTY